MEEESKQESCAEAIRERTRFVTDQAVRVAIQKKGDSVRPDGDMDSTNSLERMGRPMTAGQMKTILKRINPNFVFEVSRADPTKMGIYMMRPNVLGCFDKKFIMGMENGIMPEYSILHPEIEEMPDPNNPGNSIKVETFKQETRGWKTVFARLLHMRFITIGDLHRAAGPDTENKSQRWQILSGQSI